MEIKNLGEIVEFNSSFRTAINFIFESQQNR